MLARTVRLSAFVLVGLLLLTAPGRAQDAADVTSVGAKRTRALALSARGLHPEALPLLEELSKALPDDALVWERYGVGLYSTSATVADEEAAREMRIRAKEAFNRSRELGNRSPLAAMADALPADGSIPSFSGNPEAEGFLKAGEAAFGRGDFIAATVEYQKAVAIEPTNYNAVLFAGDAYYRAGDFERAGEWFARAIALSPNIETAHRYWGDALMKAGKPGEARAHFVDAFIAAPYSQAAQAGLSQWGQATGARFGRPNVRPPADVQKTDTGARITFDPSVTKRSVDATAAAWAMYSLVRATWQTEEFRKRFPAEAAYRHSLAEEIDAFGRLLDFADEEAANGRPLQDPQIATIRGLRDRGHLEPFVLLHAADAGIARDYEAYRAEHRDRLQSYLESMIVGGATPP